MCNNSVMYDVYPDHQIIKTASIFYISSIRDVASSKQVREPQHNMLPIANVNQDIETALKQDKSEGAMAPPPLVPL